MKRTPEQIKRISEATKLAMQRVPKEKLAVQSGKKWFKGPHLQDGLFHPDEAPEGWTPGRWARGNMGINFGQPGRFNSRLKSRESLRELIEADKLTFDDMKSIRKGPDRFFLAKRLFFNHYKGICQVCKKPVIWNSNYITKDSAVLHHCLISKSSNDPNYYIFDDLWVPGHYELVCQHCHQSRHAIEHHKKGILKHFGIPYKKEKQI